MICSLSASDASLFSPARRNRAAHISLTWMRTSASPLHWRGACAPEPRCPACGSAHEATEDRYGYVTCDACYGTGNEAHVSTLERLCQDLDAAAYASLVAGGVL